MEHWNTSMKDEIENGGSRELKIIQNLEEYLTLERNKNQYLMKKYESVREANEQFASSCESLKSDMNGLLLERTTLFQKNISLICEKNQLKKELRAQKEVLNSTSSRNKVILLNIKSAYDELVRNTSVLDEFIASHSCDKGGDQFEDYDEDFASDLRFEFNSPRWATNNPFTQVLSPIQEEQPGPFAEVCSSKSKSRLRNPLGRIDNVKDSLTMKRAQANDVNGFPDCMVKTQPAKWTELMHKYDSLTRQDEIMLKDVGDSLKVNVAKELILDGKYRQGSEEVKTPRKETNSLPKFLNKTQDEENNEKTFTVKTVVNNLEIRSTNENISSYNSCSTNKEHMVSSVQQKNIFFEKPQLEFLKQNRCFFPPLYDKMEYDVRPDKPIPATPTSAIKSKQMELSKTRNIPPLTLPMASIDENSKYVEETDELIRNSNLSSPDKNLKESSESSSFMKASNKISHSKIKKKLCSRSRDHSLEGSRKKRKSVFEILDENDDVINKDDLKQNLENLIPNNYIMDSITKEKAEEQVENDECFFTSRVQSQRCQGIRTDAIHFKSPHVESKNNSNKCIKEKKSETARAKDKKEKCLLNSDTRCSRQKSKSSQKNIIFKDDISKQTGDIKSKTNVDVLRGVQTRSRSKKNTKGLDNESDENRNVESQDITKVASRSKNSKKAENLTTRSTRSKRKNVLKETNQRSPVPTKENLYPIKNIPDSIAIYSQKENLDPHKYLPISTPKSITDPSERMNLNEISISPISRTNQVIEQKPRPVVMNTQQNGTNDTKRNIVLFDDKRQSDSQPKKEVDGKKKYLVLADLLKLASNNKVASKDDIAQMKRILINIGSDDKRKKDSVDQKDTDDIKDKPPKINSDITNISLEENISSLLSTLSPSLVSVIKSLDTEDCSSDIED